MESEGTEVIRILLVDDVEKIRESLRSILATYPHFEIVGEACDGEEAVLAVAQLEPSVVVMDKYLIGLCFGMMTKTYNRNAA